MRPFAFDSSGCLLVYLWGSSGSDRDYVACAPEALVPIQCDNSQRPAWPANRAPTRGVGEPRSPPIPRFHFGSSHGQQVIGIDKLKGWRDAHLYQPTVFHMSHSRTCSETDAWALAPQVGMGVLYQASMPLKQTA